jgi:allantoin racemase
VVSLPGDRPRHLEYHAYEALVLADIVRLAYESAGYDAIVIGCFYDIGLREAREVSGRAVVTAPCQSATAIASNLGNTFSVLVGRRKWIPKMRENVRFYGHGERLASMRPVELGVHDFQVDRQRTCECLLSEGRRAVQEDGAEVLILGCTAETYEQMQEELACRSFRLGPEAPISGRPGGALRLAPQPQWGSQPRRKKCNWGSFGNDPAGSFHHRNPA